jgi:hypothetical protein
MYCKIVTYTGTGAAQFVPIGWTPDGVLVYQIASAASIFMRATATPIDWYAQIVGSQVSYFNDPNGLNNLADQGLYVGTGFSLLGSTYVVVAFKSGTTPDFGSITWTGDGADNRNITGLGFQPDFIAVSHNNAAEQTRVWHTLRVPADSSCPFTALQQWTSDAVQSALADGFQVGTRFNAAGNLHHAVCWKAASGSCEVGSFTGDGTGDRIVNLLTITNPVFALAAGIDTGSSQGAGFYRCTVNTAGKGNRIGSVGEETQTWKAFGQYGLTVDTFMNNVALIQYYFVVSASDPPKAAPAASTTAIGGSGGMGLLPFNAYAQYKGKRAISNQMNQLIVGP